MAPRNFHRVIDLPLEQAIAHRSFRQKATQV
jgi:hypothetical protein